MDTEANDTEAIERARVARVESARANLAAWARRESAGASRTPIWNTDDAMAEWAMDEVARRIALAVERAGLSVGAPVLLTEHTVDADAVTWETRRKPRPEYVTRREAISRAVAEVFSPRSIGVEVGEVVRIRAPREDGGDPHVTGVVVTVESAAVENGRWILVRFEAPRPAGPRPKLKGRAPTGPMTEPFVETTVDTMDGPVTVRSLRQTEGLIFVCDGPLQVTPTQARALGEGLLAYAATHTDTTDATQGE